MAGLAEKEVVEEPIPKTVKDAWSSLLMLISCLPPPPQSPWTTINMTYLFSEKLHLRQNLWLPDLVEVVKMEKKINKKVKSEWIPSLLFETQL